MDRRAVTGWDAIALARALGVGLVETDSHWTSNDRLVVRGLSIEEAIEIAYEAPSLVAVEYVVWLQQPAGWWISADGQGQLDMRGGTIESAWASLLEACADDEARAQILRGTVEEVDDG